MAYSLVAILALLSGVAGWFYLFYSKAARGLHGIEEERLNRLRVRLRRVGGGTMIALATLLYVGTFAIDPARRPRVFVAVWMGVLALLGVIVVLALVDMRLTFRLRNRRNRSG